MGFTEYCLICGGPGANSYYNDDYVSISSENKDTEWLSKVQAICKEYVTKIGSYNDYGQIEIEGDDNLYSVNKSQWGDFDFISGLLVHNICLSISKNIIKNFDNKKFFNIFKNHFGNYGYLLDNIDYQGIEKNLGQDYEVKEGEEYFLADPIDMKISLKDKINKKKYIIPNFLPPEIQNIIFEHLDFKSKCIVANVCYYWYKILSNNKYWYKIYEIEEFSIEELFNLYYLDKNIRNKIKNRKRIIKCINQINLIYQKNYFVYVTSDSSDDDF